MSQQGPHTYCNHCRMNTPTKNQTDCILCGLSKTHFNLEIAFREGHIEALEKALKECHIFMEKEAMRAGCDADNEGHSKDCFHCVALGIIGSHENQFQKITQSLKDGP